MGFLAEALYQRGHFQDDSFQTIENFTDSTRTSQADTTLLAHFTKSQVTDHSEVTAVAVALCAREALEMIC